MRTSPSELSRWLAVRPPGRAPSPPASRRWRRISRRVRRPISRSGSTWPASGNRSRIEARISTRLMESMPRSASRSMSRSSISAGYPVFSAITASAADACASMSAGGPAGAGAAPCCVAAWDTACDIACGAEDGGAGTVFSGPAGLVEVVEDLAEGAEADKPLGVDLAGLEEPLAHRGEDLHALDGVDAEVGLEVHVEVEHLGRVPRLLRDHRQRRRRRRLDVGGGRLRLPRPPARTGGAVPAASRQAGAGGAWPGAALGLLRPPLGREGACPLLVSAGLAPEAPTACLRRHLSGGARAR